MKRCTKCGGMKPDSAFGRDSKAPGCLSYWCLECNRKSVSAYRKANRDRVLLALRTWQKTHKAEIKEYGAAHKEQRAENSKRWRDRHPDRAREARRRWYAAHLEHYKAYADKRRANSRKWSKSHPDKVRAKGAAYRAKKMGAVGRGVTAKECFEKYGHTCLACGSTKNLHMDHVVALANGGEHDIDNVQPLCRRCNGSKGARTIDYRKSPNDNACR